MNQLEEEIDEFDDKGDRIWDRIFDVTIFISLLIIGIKIYNNTNIKQIKQPAISEIRYDRESSEDYRIIDYKE